MLETLNRALLYTPEEVERQPIVSMLGYLDTFRAYVKQHTSVGERIKGAWYVLTGDAFAVCWYDSNLSLEVNEYDNE